MRYSATDFECLAVLETILQLEVHMIGRSFQRHTDHKAFESPFTAKVLNRKLTLWAHHLAVGQNSRFICDSSIVIVTYCYSMHYHCNTFCDGYSTQPENIINSVLRNFNTFNGSCLLLTNNQPLLKKPQLKKKSSLITDDDIKNFQLKHYSYFAIL